MTSKITSPFRSGYTKYFSPQVQKFLSLIKNSSIKKAAHQSSLYINNDFQTILYQRIIIKNMA